MYSPFDDTPIGIVNEPEDRIHFISSSRIPFSRHKRESLFEGESSLSQSVFRHKRRQIARFEIEEIRKHVQKTTVGFKILYRSDVASLLLPQTSLLFVLSTHLFIDVTQFRSLDLNLLFGSLESSIEIGVSMENQKTSITSRLLSISSRKKIKKGHMFPHFVVLRRWSKFVAVKDQFILPSSEISHHLSSRSTESSHSVLSHHFSIFAGGLP